MTEYKTITVSHPRDVREARSHYSMIRWIVDLTKCASALKAAQLGAEITKYAPIDRVLLKSHSEGIEMPPELPFTDDYTAISEFSILEAFRRGYYLPNYLRNSSGPVWDGQHPARWMPQNVQIREAQRIRMHLG